MWYFFRGDFTGSLNNTSYSYYIKVQTDSQMNASLKAENVLIDYIDKHSEIYGEPINISITSIKSDEYYGFRKVGYNGFIC